MQSLPKAQAIIVIGMPIQKNITFASALTNTEKYIFRPSLSHTVKLYVRIMNKRLRKCMEIMETQFGFMPGRSTTYAIFVMRQLMEGITSSFINLEKFTIKCLGKKCGDACKRRES